jgi:hypothetical protein
MGALLGKGKSMSARTYADGEKKYRLGYCDICCQDRPGMVDRESEQFQVMQLALTKDISTFSKSVVFVASCTACDVDICAQCAQWTRDREAVLVAIQDMGMTVEDALEGTPDFFDLAYTPRCSKCRGVLQGKSLTDINRLAKALDVFDKKDVNEKRQMASRLLRLCQEEEPYIIKSRGQEVLNKIRNILTGAL